MLEYAYCGCSQQVTFTFDIFELPENNNYDEILDTIALALISYMKSNDITYSNVGLYSMSEKDKRVTVVLEVDLKVHGQVDSDIEDDWQNFYSTDDFGIPRICVGDFVREYISDSDIIDLGSMDIKVDEVVYGDDVVCDGSGLVFDDDDYNPYDY